jgi:hypothetical protein
MSSGAKPLVFKTQTPKYDINVTVNSDGEVTDAYLINSATGIGIPADEPIMLFRAKDKMAIPAIMFYQIPLDGAPFQYAEIEKILDAFKAYAEQHPELMKEPDTN